MRQFCTVKNQANFLATISAIRNRFMKQIFRSLQIFTLTLGVALGGLLHVANAVAQINVRAEVAKPLKAAQDALQSGQPEAAAALAQQALTLPELTAIERNAILRTLAVASSQAKNFVLAVSSLESLIQELPSTAKDAEKRPLVEALLSASQQAQDYPRLVLWARQYFKLEGSNPSVRPVLIQTLALLQRHQEVVQEVQEKIKLDASAGLKTPETEYRLMAFSQRQLKDEEGYNASLKLLLQNHPSKAYWAEIIPRMARQSSFNPRFDLDLYRLLEATGNVQDTVEYMDMINLASKAGLPAEALRVIDAAYSNGVLGKGSEAATHQKLRQQIQQRAAEDDKSLPALEKSAKDGPAWSSLADVYAAKQNWELANTAYAKALSLGGLKREVETRLHFALSLFQAGKKPEALKMLETVQGDATAMELAKLWKLWMA
ncbi:MAG: hypothetical protein EBR17_02380 [Betaproteobacteria bacterium]|nr:hypothetical protein [Betaproteobacteria bacterium]NBX90685.1 hypothetical protein [Betaproteobacteria bacterium]